MQRLLSYRTQNLSFIPEISLCVLLCVLRRFIMWSKCDTKGLYTDSSATPWEIQSNRFWEVFSIDNSLSENQHSCCLFNSFVNIGCRNRCCGNKTVANLRCDKRLLMIVSEDFYPSDVVSQLLCVFPRRSQIQIT